MRRIVIKAVDGLRMADVIVDLHRRCFEADDPLVPDEFGYWWLAFDGVEAIAFAALSPSSQWQETGYLSRSGVLPEYRGHGLQKRMIRIRVKKAKRLGWVAVLSDTRQNPASANSLIGCGFKMYDPQRPWGFEDACYWRKKLTGRR